LHGQAPRLRRTNPPRRHSLRACQPCL
jgi:hypothetical protein